MMEMINKNSLVTKSNELINSRFNLTFEEQRIINYLVSMVQPEDEDFKAYTININDFAKLLAIESENRYVVIPKITKGLMRKIIEIKTDNATLQFAWLSSVEIKRDLEPV